MNADIDIRRLKHFVVLAEEENFTRAAERANLSQTAFSRSIQALEERLAVRLFDRGTREVKLTAAGQHLISKARQLIAQAQNLAREVDDIANAEGGELSFGASLMAVDGIVKSALFQLMKRSPRLVVDIKVSHWRLLKRYLEQEQIEFFVSYPSNLAQDPKFDVSPLPAIPASIFCRSGHPILEKGGLVKWKDLLDFHWATVQLRDSSAIYLRENLGLPKDASLPIALNCDNLSLLREMTLGSELLLFTWSTWLTEDIKQGSIIDIGQRLHPRLLPIASQLELGIIQLRGRTLTPAARRAIEMIKSVQ